MSQIAQVSPRSLARLSLAALAISASLGLNPVSAQRTPAGSLSAAPRAALAAALPDLPESPTASETAGNLRAAAPNAAEAELARGCRDNLLRNGDVSDFTVGGSTNFPPSVVPGWSPSVYTPQVGPTPGFGGARGWLLAWGYGQGGESFQQNVNLPAGTYRLTLATRQHNASTNPTPARYRVAFRNGATPNPWGTPGAATLDSAPMTNATWATQSYTFTTTTATNVMQVNTFNANSTSAVRGRTERVSWMAYDSFCLQKVKPAALRRGMTWTVREVRDRLVNVGNHSGTNAYAGDTPETAVLPLLCILPGNLPVPAGITPDFYHGWSKSQVRLTTPVSGSVMNSQILADGICATQFGQGWRMGEFHDGSGGHSFWAVAGDPSVFAAFKLGTKFWTFINDQNANVWNSVP
ncbi:hypothetical protein GCM10008959_19270 [Deinococcus seoulensis]|uniref:Uncharacterized protein n=1 Tax=Deinococcus seoulensis TaxID=1837379 RepID=A0ABQ2RUG3_9DEIO|nr:hypothetical protein [Deinococcus seoulensis]GGR57631.1 hypothetical protein GCM10008959_19270 [Deinococcus seoulensis]